MLECRAGEDGCRSPGRGHRHPGASQRLSAPTPGPPSSLRVTLTHPEPPSVASAPMRRSADGWGAERSSTALALRPRAHARGVGHGDPRRARCRSWPSG